MYNQNQIKPVLLSKEDFLNEISYSTNLLEWSKNDPIKELKSDNLFIILAGAPGSGKSYFIKDFLMKYKSFKVFDPDEINARRNKFKGSDNVHSHISGNTELVKKYLKNSLMSDERDSHFIYDTTGSDINGVKEITEIAGDSGYNVLVILLYRNFSSAMSSIISRGKSIGRTVDDVYFKQVYSKLKSNWKELSNLGADQFYLVTLDNTDYNFWKVDNNGYLKRDKKGEWLKVEDPQIYMDVNESRSKNVSKEIILEELKSCSDYLSIPAEERTLLYRGKEIKEPYQIIDPKSKIRVGKGQHNKDYFNALTDVALDKLNLPRRDQSLIVTTDKHTARDYGDIYIVIPKNGARFVVCPDSDFWLCFSDLLEDLTVGGLNIELEDSAKKLRIKNPDYKIVIDKLGEAFLEGKYIFMNDDEILKDFKFGKLSDFLISNIENIIKEWHVIEAKDLKGINGSFEAWTDSECLLIREDYMELIKL